MKHQEMHLTMLTPLFLCNIVLNIKTILWCYHHLESSGKTIHRNDQNSIELRKNTRNFAFA